MMPNSKKILLISPRENNPEKTFEAYPSGALLLLGTMLQNRGHEVRLVHMLADRIDLNRLESIVRGYNPQIVGMTMNTFQTKAAKAVSSLVKRVNRNILLVTGGPHPSAIGLQTLTDFPDIDIAVLGEGEHAMMEIVAGQPPETISGICFQGKQTAPRPLERNLDYLPLPNLGLVDIRRFTGADPVGAYPSMFVMASRGCPFQCTFCNKSVWGNQTRFRKPELVVQEIEWLHHQYGVREIFFQDDTFNLNRKWAERIFNLIIEKGLNKRIVYKTPFRANRRLVDLDLLMLAKRASFWMIFYGVENGNQQMLDSMKKGLWLNEIRRAFALTRRAGLQTLGSFIVGMPGETEQTVSDSITLWRELRPNVTGLATAIPFPNSEFDQEVTRRGHKILHDYDQYAFGQIAARTEALDEKQLAALYERFKTLIFRQFWKDLVQLRNIKTVALMLKKPRYIIHLLSRWWNRH